MINYNEFIMKVLKAAKAILNTISKVFLVIAVFVVIISLFFYFISQDKPKVAIDPVKQNREEIYKVINDQKLNKTKEGKLTLLLYRSVLCGTIGEACTDNPDDADKNYQKSVFGFMAKLIILPYANPPASGLYWAYSGLQKAGFVPKTYAAEGLGFAALRPLMNLWKVFRDVAYMLLVLVLIAIGFMIMFRMKINPQTVISLENALPRIVISLILITFSFPIAGFLIDLMYIFILLVIAILGNRGNFFNIAEFQNKYMNSNYGNLFILSFSGLKQLGDSLLALIPAVLNQILRIITGGVGTYLFVKFIEPPVVRGLVESISEFGGDGALPVVGQLLTSLEVIMKGSIIMLLPFLGFGLGYVALPFVIFILVCLTFVFLLFRIFFLLFSTYIKIFLLIVFSPIFLLFNALPGKNAFGFWFKSLFVYLLTFPIVIVLAVTSYLIINVLPASGAIWVPPLLAELNPQAFTVMLGAGIFFMTPELVKIVRELLGFKDMPGVFGIGTFFGGAGAAASGAMTGLSTYGSLALASPFVRNLGDKFLPQLFSSKKYEQIIDQRDSQRRKNEAEKMAQRNTAARSDH